MNEPLPPPVSLETLGNLPRLAPTPSSPARRRLARRALTGTALLSSIAVGFLAGQLAPTAIRWRRRSSRLPLALAGGLGTLALGAIGWQLQRFFVPKPSHEVEQRVGRLEVRRYPSVRVAATTVSGTWEDALHEGSLRLASFLHGGNDAHTRLRMAAPVIGAGDAAGFRLAVVLADDAVTPTPDDPRVSVSDVPPRRVAVLRFHGRRDEAAIERHKRELARELARSGLKPHGEAIFAGYDPPTTLPLFRRNELWVELQDHV